MNMEATQEKQRRANSLGSAIQDLRDRDVEKKQTRPRRMSSTIIKSAKGGYQAMNSKKAKIVPSDDITSWQSKSNLVRSLKKQSSLENIVFGARADIPAVDLESMFNGELEYIRVNRHFRHINHRRETKFNENSDFENI